MIPVARLTSDDLAGSGVTTHGSSATPSSNPGTSAFELAKKTEAATLGEVDAFLSHSWRDEDAAPGQKYAALEAWAAESDKAFATYTSRSKRRGPPLYNTYQCYLSGSEARLALDAAFAKDLGVAFGAKLVRGAYVGEAKAAGRLRGSKAETDAAYDAAVASLIEAAAAGDDVYAFLCTHNAASCEKALSKADALHLERGDDRLKFAQILGLCDGLTRSLAAAGCRAHKLVLFGATRDLAPWIGRRLAENADALGAPAAEAPALWRELARRVVG